MKIKLPDNLTVWQKELLTDVTKLGFRNQNKDILVIAPRQCYKSSTAALLMIKASLELIGDGVYIAPTLQQSRSQMQDVVKMLNGSNLIKQANYQTLELGFVNNSRIFFRSGQQKDSLRGLTAENFLVLDECCFLDPDFIMTALPLRRVKKALTIYISSPLTAEGYIWDLFNNKNTIVYDWSQYVNLIYSLEELSRLKEQYSPMRYMTEILGQFAPAGQGLLFNNITDAVGEPTHRNGLVIGVDCSSSVGGDYTAVTVMNRDYEMIDFQYNNQLEPVERVKWIADIVNKYKPNKVVVEGNSIGKAYIDLLKKYTKIPITEWTTTNSSKRDIVEWLQILFEQRRIKILNNKELIRELQAFQAIYKGNLVTYGGKNCPDDAVLSLAITCYAIKKNLGTYRIS